MGLAMARYLDSYGMLPGHTKSTEHPSGLCPKILPTPRQVRHRLQRDELPKGYLEAPVGGSRKQKPMTTLIYTCHVQKLSHTNANVCGTSYACCCIYVCICTDVQRIYTHIHTYIYAYTYLQMLIYVYIYMYMYTRMYAYMFDVYVCMYVCMYVCTQVRM